MKLEKIMLSEDEGGAYLDAYLADPIKNFTRKAILVIPGGGYSQVCIDREGEPIAQAFIPYGYQAFVLHYSVGAEHTYPTQLMEAARAIVHIKSHHKEYGIYENALFVVGFSAGGHLAACTGILWDIPELCMGNGMPRDYHKPRGMMLIYPVISAKHHMPSIQNLFGEREPSEESLNRVSLENHVTAESAPAFIFHTSTDQLVSVRNSLCLAEAYTSVGIPYEMHIYPDAPHGVALANDITSQGRAVCKNDAMAEWVRMATVWADSLL